MLLPTLRGLMRLGMAHQMTPAAVEVPWHQKRLDLVIADSGGRVIAVELKVSKWRTAIDQAYVNRWVATESWVALWHRRITQDTYGYARESGVGVLAVTPGTVYPLVRPDAPPRPDESQRLLEAVSSSGQRIRDLLSAELRELHAALA